MRDNGDGTISVKIVDGVTGEKRDVLMEYHPATDIECDCAAEFAWDPDLGRFVFLRYLEVSNDRSL